MTLGERIKARRKEIGMTQTELANKTGYADKSAISKIEKGMIELGQKGIVTFANALDTTPAFLMGWLDEEDGGIIGAAKRAELNTKGTVRFTEVLKEQRLVDSFRPWLKKYQDLSVNRQAAVKAMIDFLYSEQMKEIEEDEQ